VAETYRQNVGMTAHDGTPGLLPQPTDPATRVPLQLVRGRKRPAPWVAFVGEAATTAEPVGASAG
jgi:hypothetical protein